MHRMGTGLFLFVAAPLLFAQDRAQPDKGTDLKDVNLHDLTLVVQRVTKKTFLWTEELNLRQKRVHFVSDKPVIDNPELLFKAYQSILQVTDMGLYPAGEAGQEVYKIGLAQLLPKRPVPLRKDISQPEDRVVTRIFALQYVQPRDVQAALLNMVTYPQAILSIETAGLLLVTDYDYNIQRIEEIIKAVDVKKPDIELKLIALKHALAPEVEQMMTGLAQTLLTRTPQGRVPGGVPGMPGQEAVKVVADKRTNSVIILAEPNRLPQLEEIVRRLDSETPFETSGIYISHLRHTNAVDVARTLNAMYRIGADPTTGLPSGGTSTGVRPGQPVGPQVPGQPLPVSGSGYSAGTLGGTEPTIVPDLRSNSIIIVTDRNTYKTLEQIIRRLDQRRPQVLIKATVVEISASQNFDLGVELARLEDPTGRTIGGGRTDFGMSTIQQDAANNRFSITPVPTPGITLLALRDRVGNIPALLTALEGKARVSILDEPEAATNDNGSAKMTVTNQVPVLQQTFTGTVGFPVLSFSKFEQAETTLTISPHISEGGYLRLETTVKIEKFGAPIPNAPPGTPPPKVSREITTKEIMIPNGQTMVIGGIVTQDNSDSVQGVPILSHIPLIGWLFKRTKENQDRRTLYIFLTPYILYDYSFGDYRELTKERKDDFEKLRGESIRKLNVDLRSERLPESLFQYQRPVRRREE